MRTYNVKDGVLESNLSQLETSLADNGIRKYRNVLLLQQTQIHFGLNTAARKKFFMHDHV